jgi:UDP-N-acetylmuramoyl-tripeptide--D-alanyl-D-alanine ligase
MSVHEIDDLRIYNDAYNANPDSVLAALETFLELASDRPRRVVVLGDMRELGDEAAALHAEVGRAIAARTDCEPIDQVVLVGPVATNVATGLGRDWRGRVVQLDRIPDDPDAVAALFQAGDAILLKGSRAMAMERVIDLLQRSRGISELTREPMEAAG